MGVDWLTCRTCGENFPDCGDFVGCECGEHWCSDECAETDGFQHEEDGFVPPNSKWEQETSCDICREEDFEDYQLLTLAMKKLGLTRYELIDLYKEELKNK
jgi:hypothetical protein